MIDYDTFCAVYAHQTTALKMSTHQAAVVQYYPNILPGTWRMPTSNRSDLISTKKYSDLVSAPDCTNYMSAKTQACNNDVRLSSQCTFNKMTVDLLI